MTQWNTSNFFYSLFRILFIGDPQTPWSTFLVWLVRIITISLLLRTYIAPWLLALTSRHIRARSISLRSIKGLYFRRGRWVCRAERIGYVFGVVDGKRRLTVRIDGLKVEMQKENEETKVRRGLKHRRALTLADLHPSRLWRVITKVALKLEPWLRPLIRTYVVACLRVGIRWLPAVTQALLFELHSTVFTVAEIPGTQLVADEINLHAALELTQVENALDPAVAKNVSPQLDSWNFYGMAVWKRRMTESFHRALDMAWGRTRGTAMVSFRMSDVAGTTPIRKAQTGHESSRNFLLLPGTVALDGKLHFHPQSATVDARSITVRLKVEEIALKVDLLNEVLRAIIPPQIPQVSKSDASSVISSVTPSVPKAPDDDELISSATPTAAKRSRSATLFSNHFLPVSPAGSLLSLDNVLLSPRSSASPFFKAFSSSLSSRGRIFAQPCSQKLRDVNYKSSLSAIQRISIQVTAVALSFASSNDQTLFYKTSVKGFSMDFSPSSAATDPLHAQWLGRAPKQASFDAETFGLKSRVTTVVLERHKRGDTLPLVTLGSVDFQAVAYQWPSPWLMPSSFMQGDPNAPFLGLSLKIGGAELTDRLEDLRDFLQKQAHQTKEPVHRTGKWGKLNGMQLPSCAIQVNCGVICARVIYNGNSNALETRTNGLAFGLNANYGSFPTTPSVPLPPNSARLTSAFDFHLEPVLLHVRSGWTSVGFASDTEFLNEPSILSIGAVEVNGNVNAGAEEELGVFRVKEASISCNVHAIIDTFCVELWHADSVSAVVHLLATLPVTSQAADNTETGTPKPLYRPSGIMASLSMGRFVVVVTAPDVNPKETDLSRGIGLRSLIYLEFCTLKPSQVLRAEDVKRASSRAELGLMRERAVDALVAVKAPDDSSDIAALVRLSLRGLVARNAVATQYESDDPFLAGRYDLCPTEQEFIRIENVDVDVSLTNSKVDTSAKDAPHISINIPLIRVNFQLGSIYSALLALQTLQILANVRSLPQDKSLHTQESLSAGWSIQCRIHAIHILWALPNQTLISRLEDMHLGLLPRQVLRTHFTSLVFWVSPASVPKRKDDLDQKWDKLLTLHQWDIMLPTEDHSVSVAVKGDSVRLRIPHEYVVADLLLDVVVVAKAIKHLILIVKSGTFADIPAPEPEGPKLSPNMTLDVGHFCIEAVDDPFEARLGAIWKVGLEAMKQRLEREEAFDAKVAVIKAAGDHPDTEVMVERDRDYHFTAKHSVSVEDARRRLDEVHFLDWRFRLQNLKTAVSNQENMLLHRLYGPHATSGKCPFPDSKMVVDAEHPPLFRLLITSLKLSVSLPSFPLERLSDFLHEQGKGLPKDTEFSLLVPLHVNFTLNTLRITIRDYPIPLIHVQGESHSKSPAWTFDSDIVIAEEMGSEFSVDWIDCPVIVANQGLQGAAPMSLHVPKTIMPVKSYACPDISLSTTCPTILSWGVSYNPVIQDIVRVIESLTPNPQDLSPPIGFWDKLRLVAHWRIRVSFKGEVRCYLKGSRNPVHIHDDGAGFVLVWRGATQLLIGYPNEQNEVFEATSDVMLIAIPKFGELTSDGVLNLTQSTTDPYRKICAELHSGVRCGIGFVFERACDVECPKCYGSEFQRQCRIFKFLPHHAVRLEIKPNKPTIKGIDDSYRNFRSDFIHFSFSLVASTKFPQHATNALHLTPKAFAHFWAWSSLFDAIPTLRIRLGSHFPPRTITPKFGRHIATIKYRINLTKLLLMHGYIDDSRETWADGITPWIGIKAMIDELRVDMHQRDQETKVRGINPETTKMTRRKPFYAAEAVLRGLDLRTVLAIFKEPLKAEISMPAAAQTSKYRKYEDLPKTPLSSSWYNVHDFIELDWSSSAEPALHCIPLATCPRLAYFKRNAALNGDKQNNKFGIEATHRCLLGQEPSAPQIQISLVAARIEELKQNVLEDSSKEDQQSRHKMVALLQDYIDFLTSVENDSKSDHPNSRHYHMPSEVVLSEEWAEFEHVYQLHCPSLSLDKATRDMMIQYYHCSTERKGFEYHMATRAAKFIRDQAKATKVITDPGTTDRQRNPINTAQFAATAIRKMLGGDIGKTSVEVDQQENLGLHTDPLDGWSDGVTPQKAHCCFLLKPQVVLKGEGSADVCVVAAVQAKMQSFAIMDNANIDDPISGKIMSRNYTSLSGLQTFSPVQTTPPSQLRVPLEVLIDLRCESNEFERLVPQTDASFHYDKFNRLRLRNEITSEPSMRYSLDKNTVISHNHLLDQTDLIRVHIPYFTVSANDKHFQSISNVVTKLLLFSDAAFKARLDKLETLLFAYDFTDLSQAADVVVNLQGRLRAALETERMVELDTRQLLGEEDTKIGRLGLRAHMIMLSEELNYLFDAIKLAQDRTDERMDRKSALLLHASSSELSWRMLGEDRDLLAKLVVQHSNFYWLSRQDSATVNDLVVGNLQAFDGSRQAIWTEILCKHDEPANHPLHKRNLFLLAHWTILPPVGGISIYETFEVSLHPLKLQIDAKLGRRMMEYLWPDRRHRQQAIEEDSSPHLPTASPPQIRVRSPVRTSLDSPRALRSLHQDPIDNDNLSPALRKLAASRSVTDLRSAYDAEHRLSDLSTPSSEPQSPNMSGSVTPRQREDSGHLIMEEHTGDAAVMKTRSSQKTFIFVKISSMNLILSIVKEGSFECHDVRIKTRDLVYRNQTSSFEELVNQFIPSNMNWKGWMKMVFHQPLIPVFPVAREILSKTKWIGSSKAIQDAEDSSSRLPGREPEKKHTFSLHFGSNNSKSSHSKRSRKSTRHPPDNPMYTSQVLTAEPDPLQPDEMGLVRNRQKRGRDNLHRREDS